jgi:LysR family nitrogen assimilation transcriptional regulator
MELKTLRYYVVAVETGSLSKAAALLHIAQPALTAQVKKLEGELGVQLLERSPAGVTPTPVGLELYRDAIRLLSDANALRDRLQRGAAAPEGSVTVAVPFLMASLLMGPLIVRLSERYPRIRLFVLDDLSLMVQKAMLEGRANAAILVDTPRCEGLQCSPLAEEDLFVCGKDSDGHVVAMLGAWQNAQQAGPSSILEVAPRKSTAMPASTLQGPAAIALPVIPFAIAATLPLVLQSQRFAVRKSVERAAAMRGVTLNLMHEHDSARVIRSLYLEGAGFTFTPACTFSEYSVTGHGWLRARVVEPGIVRRYDIATPAGKPVNEATTVVLQTLREVVASLIHAGSWQARLLDFPVPG